jgi:hypothetical protein
VAWPEPGLFDQHETLRNRMVPFPLPGQEGLQILSDHPIKYAFFGIAGAVGGRRITND